MCSATRWSVIQVEYTRHRRDELDEGWQAWFALRGLRDLGMVAQAAAAQPPGQYDKLAVASDA